MRLLVISGEKDSGKTTYLRKFIQDARHMHKRVSGIITEAVGIPDSMVMVERKMRYDIIDVSTGERRCLLLDTLQYPSTSGSKVGRFTLNETTMEWAKLRLLQMAEERPEILVLDELGQLEIAGKGYFPVVMRLLNEYKGTMVLVVRHGMRERLLETLGVAEGSYDLIEIERPMEGFSYE